MKRFLGKPRFLRRRSGGFTLIELLIVIAIMGVLAAVVVPNVGRFLGRGETEAANTELQNVKSAVLAMMVDNGIRSLDANGCGTGCTAVSNTNDMAAFPATVLVANKEDSAGVTCGVGDGADWVLFGADVTCNTANDAADQVNYVTTSTTSCNYSADTKGTVTQDSC